MLSALSINKSFAIGMAILAVGFWCGTSYAQDEPASFNSSFLMGSARDMDTSLYSHGNPVSAGEYRLDMYVNGQWFGKQDIVFKPVPGEKSAETCFTAEELQFYGVDVESVGAPDIDVKKCKPLSEWIGQAQSRLEISSLRMDLTIPQENMRREARGYVNPELWDRGIDAGFIGYDLNATTIRADESGSGISNSDNLYLGMNSGVNVAGWQLRHNSSVSRRSGDGYDFQKTSTFARRAFSKIRSNLTIGDSFTNGELFDSVAYRGMNLSSEDRMLPDSMRGYAPVIRGVASTNARVEVRQNGNLLYSTTVSPGNFVIDDLYPTGFGGDLDVLVTEADGQQRTFSVPYSSIAQLLREGIGRHSVTVAQLRNDELEDDPLFMQATYQRGLYHDITGYLGSTVSQGYRSVLVGAGLATELGAFSFDVTRSQTEFRNNDDKFGNSVRINYSKMLNQTNTNFTLAAYRYSTKGFYGLSDAMFAREFDEQQLSLVALRNQKSQFQLTLNQSLGRRYGSLYFTGSVRDFWDTEGETKQYQMGYNNRFRSVSYGISAIRTTTQEGDADNQFDLSFTMPIGGGYSGQYIDGGVSLDDDGYTSSRAGINGYGGDRNQYNYGMRVTDNEQNGSTVGVNGEYRSRFASVNGSYSYSDDYQQASAGARGAFVAHKDGITMTPQHGDTMVLIEAKDAKGAGVVSASGVEVDDFGYAVLPYVTPYRMNRITLDPNGIDRNVELKGTSRKLAPYAGSITKMTFETEKGLPILIKAHRRDGISLPFAARVFDLSGNEVGVVGQSSVIFVRREQRQGVLTVKWGGEQCRLTYQLGDVSPEQEFGFEKTNAICH